MSSAAPQGSTTSSSGGRSARRRGPRRASLAGIAVLAATPLLLTACSSMGGSWNDNKLAIGSSDPTQASTGAASSAVGTPSATQDPTKKATKATAPSATSSGSGSSADSEGYPGCTAPTPGTWGSPAMSDTFSATTSSPSGWNVYSAPTGNPPRLRSQVKEAGGSLQLIGTTVGSQSVGGGAGQEFSQKYGRWEACMRADKGQGYLPAITLWPDGNLWPSGGEIDIVESVDGQRQRSIHFVHNNAGNDRKGVKFYQDISQWHLYAVDWTPHSVVFWVDGVKQWTMDEQNLVPFRTKMHMTVQLDAMNKPKCRDGCRDSSTPKHPTMYVDWVKAFPYDGQKD